MVNPLLEQDKEIRAYFLGADLVLSCESLGPKIRDDKVDWQGCYDATSLKHGVAMGRTVL